MYLSHYFVVAFFVAANNQMQLPPVPIAVLAFAAVCAVSAIVYLTIEKPLVLRTKNWLTSRSVNLRTMPTHVQKDSHALWSQGLSRADLADR